MWHWTRRTTKKIYATSISDSLQDLPIGKASFPTNCPEFCPGERLNSYAAYRMLAVPRP
jgi:hypothetical protein